MASKQARRENVADERKIEVEKDRVPKMTTHFESLAEKDVNLHPLHGERVHQFETSVPVRVSAVVESGSARKEPQKEKTAASQMRQQAAGGGISLEETQGGRKGDAGHSPSLEEISNLRGTAQHNSIEAIRAAEERYQMAKDSHQKVGALQDTPLEKGQEAAKDYTTPKDTASEKKDRASQDTSMEKGQQTKDYRGQAKELEAEDVTSTKKDTAVDKSLQAKDYTAHKATEAKDVLSSKGQSAAQYAAEKAKVAKETAVDASKVAAEYVGEKAVAAKDVTMESGKGAAGYAGKVASDVKDQAVVAGWGATHYTLEKVAEATKTVAGVTSSVAGYTKDKVAGAGQTVAGYAGEKLAAAKDAVVATEEKAADYVAKKKAEAQKDLEGKKLSHERDEGSESLGGKEQHEAGEQPETPSEKVKEYFQGGAEEGEQKPKQASSGTGTVFQAIGETIVEIGQTTKDLLVGQYPIQVVEETDEAKEKEEPYTGADGGI